MATHEDEARSALDDVREVQAAAAARQRLPDWCWHALGATVLAICLAQLLPTGAAIAVVLVLAVGIGAVLGRVQDRSGHRVDLRDPAVRRTSLPAAAGPTALVVAAAVLAGALGWWWAWVVAGVAGYGRALVAGRRVTARVAG